MPELNVMKAIKTVQIDRPYDMTTDAYDVIRDHADRYVGFEREWYLMVYSFNFGYAQGVKAEKARARRAKNKAGG